MTHQLPVIEAEGNRAIHRQFALVHEDKLTLERAIRELVDDLRRDSESGNPNTVLNQELNRALAHQALDRLIASSIHLDNLID